MMKMEIGLALVLCAILSVPCANVGALTLAKNGKTEYVIAVAKDAIAPEKTAAKELQSYLKQVTGADFTIQEESKVKSDMPQILVGPSGRAKNLAGGVDWQKLGMDGIVIRTVGNSLVLAGGRPRGTLYAVYSFLEDTVGCRWWTSSESTIPRKATLTIPKLNTVYTPKLRYREAFYRDPLENPTFAARLKLNGHFYRIPEEYGSHYSIIGWCHTFYSWLPPDRYFGQHPEWYSEINGKRTTSWAQLCLTNEEMRKEMTKVVLEKIRRNPDAGIISVSQNDCHGNCQCTRCRALEEKEGSPSGPLIHFVNAIAAEVEKEFPNVLVETLAYQYTRKAPKFAKPRHNVVVRLCTIECSFTQPLDSEHNKSFRDDIHNWKAIAPNLYIWDYVTSFASYIYPHPNLRVLAPNLRFFEKNNVIGVFEQGDSATTVGDFVRLRAWLFGHLEWDPSRDEKKLMAEFMQGYYGSAAPFLTSYLNIIHNRVEQKNKSLGCYHQDASYLSLQDMNTLTRLFDEAERAAAKDPILLKRIKRERMPLDHAWLIRYHELKAVAEKQNLPFFGPKDPKAACNEFIRMAREWKAANYSEGMAFESYVPSLKARFAPPPPKPEEFEKLPKEDVVEIQDVRFTLYNPPVLASLVDDPRASDGRTARLNTNTTEWAVQYHITEDVVKSCPGEWSIYVIARVDPIAKAGWGFRYGLYDNAARREVATMGESIEHAGDDNYHTYYLGDHELKSSYYIWLCPMANPGEIRGVYIDRILFVKVK